MSGASKLIMLIVAPTIWSAHFLISYVAAAVICAKAPDSSLASLRFWLLVLTAASLAGIVAIGVRGLRYHLSGVNQPLPHEEPTAGDRQRFLGFATLLLAGLSATGVVFVALPLFFMESCR